MTDRDDGHDKATRLDPIDMSSGDHITQAAQIVDRIDALSDAFYVVKQVAVTGPWTIRMPKESARQPG